MPPIKTDEHEKEQQVVITLALMQRALEEISKRVDEHHKVLFGNGSPENSIVWAIKEISESITRIEDMIKKSAEKEENTKKELDNLRGDDANLSWKQWFKKITIKWLPIMIILGALVITFHIPIAQLLILLVRLMGG